MGILDIFFSRKNEKRWTDLHSALHQSFSNIKNDMHQINQRLNSMEKEGHNVNELQQRMNRVEPRVDVLFNIRNEKPEPKETEQLKLPEKIKVGEIDLTLTQRQLDMLEVIYRLQKETKRDYIPVKLLATELYPTKEYKSNKSLMSDYTELLKDLNYIRKIRKGRKAHVKLTKKGKNTVKSSIKKVRID